MESLQSTTELERDVAVDHRPRLYYGKYLYRARFALNNTDKNATYSTMLKYTLWFKQNKKTLDVKQRKENRTISVFSNEMSTLRLLETVVTNEELTYSRAQPNVVDGVMYFARIPEFNYRIYFKSGRIDLQKFIEVVKFLDERRQTFSKSQSLKRTIHHNVPLYSQWSNGTVWLYSSHYIDFKDEKMASYMYLRWGEILGKCYELRCRNVTYIDA